MRGKEDNEQRIAQGVRVLRAREGEYGEILNMGMSPQLISAQEEHITIRREQES